MSNSKKSASYSSYKKMKKNIKTPSKKELEKLEKTRKIKKILTITLPIVFALMLITTITISILNDNGVIIRSTKVIDTEFFKVDGAMMTYLFWDTVNDALEGENAGGYKMMGFSSIDDLDKIHSGKKTWRKYFSEVAIQSMQSMLSFANYAKDSGKVLNDDDNIEIEKEIMRIEAAANVFGIKLETYIKAYYGRGVNMDDIRKTLEIIYLSAYGMDLLNENTSVTQEEIEAYYNTDKDAIQCVDYHFFVAGISGKDNLTEEQKEFYSTRAGYISQAETEEEFIKRVTDFLKEENDRLPSNDPKKLSADELEEFIKSEIANMKYEKAIYDKNNPELDDWIFSDAREAGQTYLNHQEGFGTYGVVFIIKPKYIPENWQETAKSNILAAKKRAVLDAIDEKYVIDVKKAGFVAADIA